MDSVRLARLISILCVPPTFSALAFTWLFFRGDTGTGLIPWVVAILFGGVIQIGYVLYLLRGEHVSSYDVPDRFHRTGPYLVSTALALAGVAVLALLDAPLPAVGLMWCFVVNTLILVGINRFWKISAHMMGLSTPAAYLLPQFGALAWILIPLALMLGWARIKTGSHTLSQVAAGAAAGFFLTLAQIPFIHDYGPWVLQGWASLTG